MTTVLQINTNGAVLADDLLADRVSQGRADVSLVSEQYRYRARSTTIWFADDSDSATVWIAGRHRSKIAGRGKGVGFVWAHVGDVTYVSVYISPNLRRNEFLRQVECMEDVLRDISGLLLVAGDFNARAIEWGMPETNSKGRDLLEMAARLGLVVANEGSVTTYRRPGFGESMPQRGNGNHHQPAYWCTEEIAELRRTCLRLHRRAQRVRKRRVATLLNAEFKQAQKRLRLAIKGSVRQLSSENCSKNQFLGFCI